MSLQAAVKNDFGRPGNMLLLSVCWFLSGSVFRDVLSSPADILPWFLGASFLSVLALGAVGYFERHLPRTRMGELLNLFLVLPSSALAAKGFLDWADRPPPFGIAAAVIAAGGAAFLFESAHWLESRFPHLLRKRWDLDTYLPPEEQSALAAQIASSGASDWIRVHPHGTSPEGAAPRDGSTLVISRRTAHDLKAYPEILTAHLRGQRVVDVTQLLKELRGRVRIRHADGWSFLMGSTYQSPAIRFYFHLKNAVEPVAALVLLVLLSPLLLVLAAAVRAASPGPAFYRQERSGHRGRPFRLFKFRTMTVKAEGDGPRWAKENDDRVTPLGRWLRKTHLDELPQLINVVRRELSFVGPRPERPEFYKLLEKEIPLFHLRLLVRPGITGWAQTKQRYAGTVEECKIKLEYDLYYVQNMSPGFDLRILVDTAALLLRGNGGR
jgi:lipopolysaccharide/colanic/teichoic acid biosynthesis glycosyltransferase